VRPAPASSWPASSTPAASDVADPSGPVGVPGGPAPAVPPGVSDPSVPPGVAGPAVDRPATPDPTTDDPVARLVLDAAEGRFPTPDGSITVLPPDRTTGLHAVLSFTAHAVVLTDRSAEEVAATGLDAYGGATDPAVLLALAGTTHRCGVLDASLARRGSGLGATTLVETDAHDDHHRVGYARHLRRDVRVFADEAGLVTLGRGIGGRWELGIELADGLAGRGRGGALLDQVVGLVPADEWLFAACAPGNARSLRALLAAGFIPFGSEVLLYPAR